MSTRVRQRFFSILMKGAFLFEPLAPRVISYYLTRQLKELESEGRLSSFHAKTRRLGKFHYKMEINLELTPKQAARALDDLLLNKLKRERR
ncbi:MAG: hypothetical protein QXV09_01740 [Candidatus Bathyarchaeia archaeon]